MQLAIAVDPAAVCPCLPQKFGLTRIFSRPLAQGGLEPSVGAAGMDAQAATHRPDREQWTMLGDERVSHFASLAKYAVAFLECRVT